MSIEATLTYNCNGCDAKTIAENIILKARKESVFGGNLVKVTITPKLDPIDHIPDGWVAYDPYTLMTYCGDCWLKIEDGEA